MWRRWPGERAWIRQPLALMVALVLNGALVLFLAAWTGRSGGFAETPPVAVPLEVVPATPEQVEIAGSHPERREELTRPVPAEPIPLALPDLKIRPPDLAALPELCVPPDFLESLRSSSLDLPDYTVTAPEASGVPELEGSGTARGPLLISSLNLSQYYPRRALRRGTTGKSTIRLTTGADGRVLDVEVIQSTPAGVFEHAARRVGRALRFRPARRDGRNVSASVSLNLIWKVE